MRKVKFPQTSSEVVLPDNNGELNSDRILPTCASILKVEDLEAIQTKYEIPDSVES